MNGKANGAQLMLQLSLVTAGTGDVPCLEASLGSELQGSC